MSSQMTYLSPGFVLTFSRVGQKYLFSQFQGQLKRTTPARLAIVDALNKGYEGDLEDLQISISQKLNTPRPGIRKFMEEIESSGYLTNTPPKLRYEGEPSDALGVVGDEEVIIATPASFVTQAGQYYLYGHEGTMLLRLTLAELFAAAMFIEPMSVAAAKKKYLAENLTEKIDGDQFDNLVARIAGAELFCPPIAKPVEDEAVLYGTVDRNYLQTLVDARIAAHDVKVADEGKDLVQVVPVNTVAGTTPAALGLLMAYGIAYESGRLRDKYDFVPMFLIDEPRIIERASSPGVFIFSNYLWNVEENLKLSAAVKAINPRNITIHGGPSTPSYEKDCEDFFSDYSHVDIAVRGEGELTFADILDKLNLADSSDLDVLHDVNGLTYRTVDGVRRTENRERIPDLDTIPSPYITGLFEEFGIARSSAVIESNRGCPYGCTFCDWGSATLSKVRRFDLERVFAELEWSAKYRSEDASIADANYGMLARDVEITQKIADFKKIYGFPNTVGINYAKNQVKYLADIIRILAEADILTEGKISLQSMDETTLKVIDRSNIKISKYNELATEFRRANLPLGVELMMGLPGSTSVAFRNDLQDCTNRDVRVQVNPTIVLPNSPMNAPSYRKEHGILAKPGEMVQECATYTRGEWDSMIQLRTAYALLDTYGIVRYVARYVRSEAGTLEIDFYDKLQLDAASNPTDWPVIADALKTLEDYMAPPGSWSFFVEELGRYVVEQLGLADNSGLRTALTVQKAHLPAADRKFPCVLNLEHDFTAWWSAMLEVREQGRRTDWEKHVPRLSEFGPATITITDPNKICHLEIGKTMSVLSYSLRTWELDSPVARARTAMGS